MDSLKVALIGAQGSGKTCFIAGLRWLGGGNVSSRFTNIAAVGESKTYLDALTDALCAGQVPDATYGTHRLSFEEIYRSRRGRNRELSFEIVDYKGGDLGTADENSNLFKAWEACDYLLLLLDVDREGRFPRARDLSRLFDVIASRRMMNSGKHLCLLLTKADRHGRRPGETGAAFARPFVEEKFAALIDKIENVLGFSDWTSLYVASLGVEPDLRPNAEGKSVAALPQDGGIRPFGYEEICDWIVATADEARSSFVFRKARKWIFGGLVLLAALGGWMALRHPFDEPDDHADDDFVCFRSERGPANAAGNVAWQGAGAVPDEAERRATLKAEIAAVDVGDATDVGKLRMKLLRIESYPFADPAERQEAQSALETVRTLLDTTAFHLANARVGELDGERRTYLLFAAGDECDAEDLGDGKERLVHTDYQDGTAPQWQAFSGDGLRWRPGQKIAVEWRWNATFGFGDKVLARRTFEGDALTLLRLMAGRVSLQGADGGFMCSLKGEPWLTVACRELPDAERTLPLVEKYVVPGSYWQGK